MAEEAISIPSPSVFLRNSPPRTASQAQQDNLPPAPKNARRQGAATKKAPARKQSAATKVDGAQKPKQSKSRNGESMSSSTDIYGDMRIPMGITLIAMRLRLRHLQIETAQMWRRETRLPAMCEAKGALWRLQEGLQMAAIRGDECQDQH